MKKQSLIIAVTALSLLNVRCSDWGKEPADGFDQLNERARTEQQQLEFEKAHPPVKPAPEKVVVRDEKLVKYEVTKISASDVVIAPDAQIDFVEGKTSTFKVRVSTTLPGLNLELKQDGLPQGASFEKSQKEKDVYLITWNPPYSLSSDDDKLYDTFTVKFTAEVLKSSDPAMAAKVQGLAFEKETKITLRKSQEAPKDVKIVGLSNEIEEGQITTFKVTAVVPGYTDKSAKKPRLDYYYDGVSVTNGNKFQESNGALYIVSDLAQKDAKYLGNSTWEFSKKFDTAYIPVQPQLGLDGKAIANADGVRVRVSFKVVNGAGLSAPEITKQIKIRYKKTAAPAAPAQPATEEKAP
ncbi:hypothetical protein [Bdellovibrio sp. HCB2-146]|uniref:hypothetical protein n=1 Tax=Bdellovibrio sp. HCB2-146 TaxID=3394362 RepID=UPI0039BC8708